MAERNAITFETLARSPLPLWAAGLLIGQGMAGARWQIAGEVLAAVAAGALLALRPRPRLAVALLLFTLGHEQVSALLRPPADPAQVAHLAPGKARLRARIADVEARDGGRLRVLLEVDGRQQAEEWLPARGLVQLTLVGAQRSWQPGTRLEAELGLRRPRNFGNAGELDYESYLARRGIYVTSFLLGDGALTVIEAARGGWLDRWRQRIRAHLAELASPQGEILAALLLGEQGALPSRLRDDFAAAGVSHVLSISGLHVAMVAGCAYAAVRWLLARSRRLLLRTRVPVLATAFSLAPVWVYAELARAGVATWRAVCMLTLVVAAVTLGRRRDLGASLAAAAIGVSALWPGAVLDVSFQLSFVAVAALALGMQLYWRWWSRRSEERLLRLRHAAHRWLGWALASVALNASVLAATAPLTAYHFNQIPVIALAANPIVVPLIGTAAVALGLLGAAAAALVPAAAAWAFAIAGAVAQLGAAVATWMAALPGAGVKVVSPSGLELLLVYAALALAVLGRGRQRRLGLALVLAAMAVDAAWWTFERHRRSDLRATFLSVGQGDCTVVEFPGSEVMVIDGGGLHGLDAGERIVAPYLWGRKITRVDYLVLTHPQFDHYGGLAYVARHFAPRELWHNGETSTAASYARLQAEVVAGGVKPVRVAAGMSREIGDCRVDVLWPPAVASGLGVNDASVVLRIECGDASLLLPGDLQAAGETALVASTAMFPTTVLKVGHHGSRTSSSALFLEALAPGAAVISAGHANRFGFPDPRVLRAFDSRGIAVYRTDLDGAVTLRATWDGRLTWSAALPGALDPLPSFHGR